MTRRGWPMKADHKTAEPRPKGLDLTEAADNYAEQIPAAIRRAGGFRLGDPVRRKP